MSGLIGWKSIIYGLIQTERVTSMKPTAHIVRHLLALWILVATVGACTAGNSTLREDLLGDNSTAKIEAIDYIAKHKMTDMLETLIDESLRDEDEAVRVFACRALRDMTGESFDYEASRPWAKREEAVKRWKDWLLISGRVSQKK